MHTEKLKRFNEKLEKIKQKINLRSMRERALLLLTGISVIFFVVYNAYILPIEANYMQIKERRQYNQNQLAKILDKVKQGKVQLASDPYAGLKLKIQKLQKNLPVLNSEITSLAESLILPNEMSDILENVLLQVEGLTLLELESLPTEKLKGEQYEQVNVYRHGLRISFEGSYFDTLNYLEKLEAYHQQLIWGDLDYKVQTFPVATVTLTVYTLSEAAGWIGV